MVVVLVLCWLCKTQFWWSSLIFPDKKNHQLLAALIYLSHHPHVQIYIIGKIIIFIMVLWCQHIKNNYCTGERLGPAVFWWLTVWRWWWVAGRWGRDIDLYVCTTQHPLWRAGEALSSQAGQITMMDVLQVAVIDRCQSCEAAEDWWRTGGGSLNTLASPRRNITHYTDHVRKLLLLPTYLKHKAFIFFKPVN